MLNTLSALRHFHNPWRLLSDRAGLGRAPYLLRARSGLTVSIRPQTGDRFTAFETFGIGVYDGGLRVLCPGDTVVDIGANIGCFALSAAARVGPSGRVIAAEPEQRTFDRLSHNIGLNAASAITPIRKAVAGQSGTINIYAPTRSTLFSSKFDTVDHRKIEGEVQVVQSVTLEQLMDEQGVARLKLLKMDCEGAEHEIIEGLTPSVAAKIDNMVIEFHQVAGREIENSVDKLRSLGYAMRFSQNYVFSR